MTIGRRGMFGLGALGFGAVALEGCGSGFMPGPRAAMTPEEVESLLTELDRIVLHLKALDSDPAQFGIKGKRPEVAAGREACIGTLTTLCLMGTYRDVPEAVWREPRIEEHLKKTLPEIDSNITRARNHLVNMSDEEIAAIDKKMLDDPNLPMRVMEQIDRCAKEIQVPLEQRTYLRLTTAQLAARFRYEGTGEVRGKLAGKYDRMLSSRIAELDLGEDSVEERRLADRLDDETRPAAATSVRITNNLFSAPAKPRLANEGESCSVTADCEEPLLCAWGECSNIAPKSKRVMTTAKHIAKWGAIFLIPPLCAIGILILLVDLFIVIAAGIIHAGEDPANDPTALYP